MYLITKSHEQDTYPNNVILFPKMLDVYQIQLTRFLETEQYGEAVRLLQFLLGCQGVEQHKTEWQALLDWLLGAFPDAGANVGVPLHEEDESEEKMAEQYFRNKVDQDPDYVNKLLDSIVNGPLTPQKLLGLEQLTYLDHPEIDDVLRTWLVNERLPALMQFHILQTLRKRGARGTIQFHRGQDTVELEIEDTPIGYEDFPSAVRNVPERVREQTEVQDPGLSLLALDLWQQCVMAMYGTSAYRSILADEDATIDIWAAALHIWMREMLSGGHDIDAERVEIREYYGITDALRFRMEQAHKHLKNLIESPLLRME
ncbi:hypothetical protein [Paenibacillus guangzhouensis]|uniref:hypothetical protein n=1 Tax=Paenibacillus guangzhouensis TaxID=1473112 RepID=UPI002AB1B9A1|nr:hypothetical protein [Paenibacillus guangzhouensis]